MLSPIKRVKKEKVDLERENTKAGREYMDRPWRWAQRCPWPPMCGNEATLPVAPIDPNLSVITGTGSSCHFPQTNCFSNEAIIHQLIMPLGPVLGDLDKLGPVKYFGVTEINRLLFSQISAVKSGSVPV